jgi:hypothetical protein
MPLNIFAQRPIDARLITFIGGCMALEPSYHIGIKSKRQLLLDWSIEHSPFRV